LSNAKILASIIGNEKINTSVSAKKNLSVELYANLNQVIGFGLDLPQCQQYTFFYHIES